MSKIGFLEKDFVEKNRNFVITFDRRRPKVRLRRSRLKSGGFMFPSKCPLHKGKIVNDGVLVAQLVWPR